MSNPINQYSRQARVRKKALTEVQEEMRKRREALHWCGCTRPLKTRKYPAGWSCRFCGKLIR